MRYRAIRTRRRGTILPMLALCTMGLFALVAMAIDIGMLAVAKAHAQNAADSAAMAGARALNGDVANNNNYTAATPTALAAAAANVIMGTNVLPGNCTIDIGSYAYDTNANKFIPNYTGKVSADNWSLCRATVGATRNYAFAKVLGFTTYNVTAQATAVHRPRDMALILDFSGSMRFDSLMGGPHTGARTTPLNPDTNVPTFGHYSSGSANLIGTSGFPSSGGEYFGLANITIANPTGSPPVVEDFYKHNQGAGTHLRAFTPTAAAFATIPGGDEPLKKNLNAPGQPYAETIQQVLNLGSVTNGTYDLLFQTDGYNDARLGVSLPFNGYTEGPNYWGKTFFIWPPDPRWSDTDATLKKDWRKKFFKYPGAATRIDDNSRLWDSSGNWRVPRSSSTTTYYDIDYTAILSWIKNSGPNPFPSQLRAGRILYYDAIPDSIDTSSFPPTNLNQRFWKEYIDHVLGVEQTGTNSWSQIISTTGYGDNFTWGTIRITANTSLTGTAPLRPYMHYQDNPKRPRLHMWFGPITMVDFIGNYNQARFWWPGTCHEAQCWQLKVGVAAGLNDIKLNHPNDLVSTIYFSVPKETSGGSGRFNQARVKLSSDYPRMNDALWFPFVTLDGGGEIRPWDAGMLETPHADGGTSPSMGFMLAYNQFSGNQAALKNFGGAPIGINGGCGRRGAQKVLIFETDGMANTPSMANFTNAGPTLSYYNVRQGSANEFPSVGSSSIPLARDDAYAVADRMVALETDGTNGPGYSTARKPCLIHCLAFGSLFEGYAAGSNQTDALNFLHTLQVKGKTNAGGSSLPSYKIITGNSDQRIAKIKTAFSSIMQDGVQVTLIE